jgi:hypothetical protein
LGDGTLYTVLADMHIDSFDELAALKQKYDCADHVPTETARLMKRPHGTLRKVFPFFYA